MVVSQSPVSTAKTVFNIDANFFFELQIRILEWFLKDHGTLKPGVIMLKILI